MLLRLVLCPLVAQWTVSFSQWAAFPFDEQSIFLNEIEWIVSFSMNGVSLVIFTLNTHLCCPEGGNPLDRLLFFTEICLCQIFWPKDRLSLGGLLLLRSLLWEESSRKAEKRRSRWMPPLVAFLDKDQTMCHMATMSHWPLTPDNISLALLHRLPTLPVQWIVSGRSASVS